MRNLWYRRHLGSLAIRIVVTIMTTNDYVPIDWDKLNAEHEENQKIRWAKLPKLIKEFYKEHPEVTSMSQEDVDAFRKENNNIAVSNFDEKSDAPLLNPASEFRHCFEPYPDVMATIEKQAGQCAINY